MHAVVVLTVGLLFSAPSLEDVNRAVRDVLADSGVESEYPVGEEAPRLAPSRGSSIGTSLLWVLAGVCFVLVAVSLVRALSGYTRDVGVEPVPAPGVPARSGGGPELADAQALADAGRYEEAVHLLLLHALREIEQEGTRVLSHTSREVIRAASLASEAREAVEDLVGVVEVSWFGGRPIDADGYAHAAASYRRFRAARA